MFDGIFTATFQVLSYAIQVLSICFWVISFIHNQSPLLGWSVLPSLPHTATQSRLEEAVDHECPRLLATGPRSRRRRESQLIFTDVVTGGGLLTKVASSCWSAKGSSHGTHVSSLCSCLDQPEKEVTSSPCCIHMHLHRNPTDTQHRRALTCEASLCSTTPQRNPSHTARSTFGCQAEFPPSTDYEPNLYYEDNTPNLYVSIISSDTVQSSVTSAETEDAALTLPAESLLLSSGAEQLAATSDEIPNVPEEERRLPKGRQRILSWLGF